MKIPASKGKLNRVHVVVARQQELHYFGFAGVQKVPMVQRILRGIEGSQGYRGSPMV